MHTMYLHRTQREKTYLTRTQSRRWALDNPIGDPTGGPAYGERNDPVSAIISVVGIVGGYGAATAAGATLAGMVLGGMAMAGGALSLIGNVTGNKSLMKIGGIIGGIGGIGLAAGSLGMFDLTSGANSAAAGAAAAGEGVTPAQALDMSLANPAAANLAEANPLLAVQEGGAAAAASAPVAAQTFPVPGVGGAAEIGADAALDASLGSNLGQAAGPAAAAGDASAMSQWAKPAGSATKGLMSDPSGGRYMVNNPSSIKTPGVTDLIKSGDYGAALKTAGSNIMDLAKSNPGAANMLGNAVGAIADQLSGKTDAEINMYLSKSNLQQAEADQIRRAIEIERERRARLNQGYLNVNQGININKNAIPGGIPTASPNGLIAGARAAG